MVEAVSIEKELARCRVLKGRRPDTDVAEEDDVFATLAAFREGGIYAGSFEGESPWERHPMGDELVHVLKGSTRLTILTGGDPDGGPDSEARVLEMTAGMLTVVPKGCWHKFEAPDGVTVLTATPTPTDHSATDPRRKS